MNSTHSHDDRGPGCPGTNVEILDSNVLQSLKELGGDDDPGLFLELIDLFLQDAPQRMQEIEQGLADGDIRRLERAAHTLKSSSANIGALSLSALFKRMEGEARMEQSSGLPELYARSQRLWPQVEAALRAAKS